MITLVSLKTISSNKMHHFLTLVIAAVWLINGLFFKILNFVPRHRLIVERIFNTNYSREITISIGVLELVMVAWILSAIWRKINAVTQIVVILLMNVIEYFLAPDLLLFGKMNFVFALLFSFLIFYNEFYLSKKVS